MKANFKGTQIINNLSGAVINSAMKVHSQLGPGLLESAYEACLVHELITRGIHVRSQVALPIRYDGVEIDIGYRVDLLVEQLIVVELKVVEKIKPIHLAQVLSYIKLSNLNVGLLINFNTVSLKDGITRIVHRF